MASRASTTERIRFACAAAELLFAGVWLGGILVLGAIVAPTVFHEVPAPASADAMTHVFVSFDRLAISAAAIIAVCEVVRMRFADADAGVPTRVDAARLGAATLAGACAIVQGLWLSPTIVSLHQRGAIRGLGELGERLERFHAWSERCGKTEALLVTLFIVLLAYSLRTRARSAEGTMTPTSHPPA
jgi:uncharacterized membrane protein